MSKINIINASAGSGKTYRLTHLAGELIMEANNVTPDTLFATTFTIKAAGELEERLRQHLLSRNMLNEVNLLPEGFIGTVNSVCARLLMQYAIDAGKSPAIGVIPDDDTDYIFDKAIANAINEYTYELEPVARRLSRIGGGDKFHKNPDWKEDVKNIVNLSRINCLDKADISECAKKSWDSFSKLFSGVEKYDTDFSKLIEAVSAVICYIEGVEEEDRSGEQQKRFTSLKEIKRTVNNPEKLPWTSWAKLSKLTESEICAAPQIRELAKGWFHHPLFYKDMETMIFGVFGCAASAVKDYKDYKDQHGLMDFIDQESEALKLLREKENQFFRDSLKDRLSLLLVDEFQDTSPLQLAIFTELNRLCGNSYWVGDPKQSIYGFRGADMNLMNAVVKSNSKNETLPHSYRSRENLIHFSNVIFKNVFHEMHTENKVCLTPPSNPERDIEGGVIEAWLLDANKNEDVTSRLADAIQSLLHNKAKYPKKDLKPSDIAILCRSNKSCDAVAEALEKKEIRASTARGLLARTPACRLVLSAMRYLSDKNDTLAMIELINFMSDYENHKDWLSKLVSGRDEYLEELKLLPVFKSLDERRWESHKWTPLEVMEYAIEVSGVLQAAASWDNTAMALANLDKLRQTCVAYLDLCEAHYGTAGLYGYFSYLNEKSEKEAEGSDDQAVQVLTYHKAKGLEWPVVILFNLDADPDEKASAFNLSAKTEGNFDPENPLNKRTLHFWPKPVSIKSEDFDNLIKDSPEESEARKKDIAESQRLLYVGITRAMDVLILAIQQKTSKKNVKTLDVKWLEESLIDKSGESLIKLPGSNDEVLDHTLNIGDDQIAIKIRTFTEDTKTETSKKSNYTQYRPVPAKELPHYVSSRITPSKIEGKAEDQSKVRADLIADFKTIIKEKEKPDYASLGNAVHNFLSLVQGKRSLDEWKHVAQRLLTRYGVDKVLTDADMIAVYERLNNFIKTNYPNAKILRECPISLREANNQVMHGFIDMLLELDEGYVIIDHKTFAGADIAKEEARKYAPQLNAYRRAVAAATNKKVLATLIHMPIIGIIYEVK
ncbi:MAG: UvrD-helicase domain-containing protein [Termitinemataceae bacterium]|nr:MAG: UvrD-helicase domain-containing protein [Termitinemataceae bacterium]